MQDEHNISYDYLHDTKMAMTKCFDPCDERVKQEEFFNIPCGQLMMIT